MRAAQNLGKLLAFAGLTAIAALTLPGISDALRQALLYALMGIWAYFIGELGWHIWSDRVHPRALVSLGGFADILAVAAPAVGPFIGLKPRDWGIPAGIWVLKLLSGSSVFQLIWRVLANEARNLLGVLSVFVLVLFSASLVAYVLERDSQPESFGSLPQAMWWAVTTLTTTGYGDAIPGTILGRVLSGLVMVCGIAVFALWAGILATGFAEEISRRDFMRNWELVAKVPLFRKLSPADLLEIARALSPREVASGSLICRKGDPGDEMYFILDGEVTVALNDPVTLGPGQFFGEMALLTGERRSTTVTAATAVSLLALHASDVHMLLARSPEAAEAIRSTAQARRAAR